MSKPLLGVRAFVILLFGGVVMITVGVLTFASTRDRAAAVLSGFLAAGAAIVGAHALVGGE